MPTYRVKVRRWRYHRTGQETHPVILNTSYSCEHRDTAIKATLDEVTEKKIEGHSSAFVQADDVEEIK